MRTPVRRAHGQRSPSGGRDRPIERPITTSLPEFPGDRRHEGRHHDAPCLARPAPRHRDVDDQGDRLLRLQADGPRSHLVRAPLRQPRSVSRGVDDELYEVSAAARRAGTHAHARSGRLARLCRPGSSRSHVFALRSRRPARSRAPLAQRGCWPSWKTTCTWIRVATTCSSSSTGPYYPPERILLLTTEELRRAPQTALARVTTFLGARPYDFDTDQHENVSSRRGQASALGRLIESYPAKRLGRRLPRSAVRLAKGLNVSLSRQMGRPTLDPESRSRLRAYLAEDVTRLRDTTGLAFADWSL